MLKRLRIKFICINMVIVTIMLCIIFSLVFHFTKQGMEVQSIQMMRTIATRSVRQDRPEGIPGERPSEPPKQIRLPYFSLEVNEQRELVAADGGYYDLSDEAFLRGLMTAVFEREEQVGVLNDYNLRYCHAVTPMGERIVFADISSEQAAMNTLLRNCILIGLLSLLLFFIISLFLARWAVKPVEKAWQQQHQFVADASHELKTPLTVITTNAELLQKENDEEERRQFSDNILTMSRQMRGLVEGLLELARVDNGAVKAAFSSVDLSALVNETVLPFEPLYFEQGLELCCAVEGGLTLRGSEAHLRQVTEILLDNAMKYAETQSKVDVRLKKQGSHCLLSVASRGEELSREECERVFERFYRVDKVRTMSHSYGLGLSIARSIVEKHGGRIWAESGDGVNTFRVLLPAG